MTSAQNAYAINGHDIEDRSKWCDYCGKDMVKPFEIPIQGRILTVHKKCAKPTTEFYSL